MTKECPRCEYKLKCPHLILEEQKEEKKCISLNISLLYCVWFFLLLCGP